MHIGFIGLGHMGGPMAANLLKAGHQLSVFDLSAPAVAAQVNALPQVAHNYRREHRLNMWFVLATDTPAGIPAAIADIEAATGLLVHAFPKEREYFVEMKLAVR